MRLALGSVIGSLVLLFAISANATDEDEEACTDQLGRDMAELTASDIHSTSNLDEITMEYFDGLFDGSCTLEDLSDEDLESIALAYDKKYGEITGADEQNKRRKFARIQFLEWLKLKRNGGI